MSDDFIGTPPATGATPAYVPAVRATTDTFSTTDTFTTTGELSATDDASTKDVAKDQAAGVAKDAKQGAADVAQTAKDETAKVVSEAGKQAKDLFQQTRSELTEQAATQQQRVAGGLRSLSQELSLMGENSEQSGVASDLVRQGADRVASIASWLEDREPGSMVEEVKSLARAKPGTFLAVCAGLGLVAGRLSRNLASDASGEDSKPAQGGSAKVGYTSGDITGATLPARSVTGGSADATDDPMQASDMPLDLTGRPLDVAGGFRDAEQR